MVKTNYKDPLAKKLICEGHCSYYRPGPDKESACKGFTVLDDLIKAHPEITAHLTAKQDGAFKDKYPNLLRHALCQRCDFFVDGCDFTDPEHTGYALPCGGYLGAGLLLERGESIADQLLKVLIPEEMKAVLSPQCALKYLEVPHVYDTGKDELFELDQAGFDFLKLCNGNHILSDIPHDKGFLEFCLKEELLVMGFRVDERHFILRPSPVPSLRYLELQLTKRCNLQCRHCYLRESAKVDLPLSDALSVLGEFEEIQGLRVLFSGGEPLLYPELPALNDELPRFGLRKVLLTNGTLIAEDHYSKWCHFDEIQFSVDGLQEGHEAMRGLGTYLPVMRGIETAQKRGIPVSIATMVHRYSLKEFDEMAKWVEANGFVEWNIDVPCQAGRLFENPEYLVTPDEGAPCLQYAAGGSYHEGGDEPFACGYHLSTVTAEGNVLKCGFFQEPLGTIREGLEVSWKRARPIPLGNLECGPCPHLAACKGGCRFRAASPLGKDPVMCALYGQQEP